MQEGRKMEENEGVRDVFPGFLLSSLTICLRLCRDKPMSGSFSEIPSPIGHARPRRKCSIPQRRDCMGKDIRLQLLLVAGVSALVGYAAAYGKLNPFAKAEA